MLCWMSLKPLRTSTKYVVKRTTRETRCLIRSIDYVLDINTLEQIYSREEVQLNEIACVELKTTKPLFFDSYSKNRITGSLILIDESTNETLGAGMII